MDWNWARRWAPLLSLVALYPVGAAAFGLFGPDEPRYADIARRMAESGDWVTPVLYGEPWLEKPPLLYWLSAIGFQVGLGPETAPRVPLAVVSALFVLWFALTLVRWLGEQRALGAGMLLAASAGWIAYSHVAVTDVPLAICFGAALVWGLRWIEDGRARDALFTGAWLGAAMLAKGLVPCVLAVPLIWCGRGRWRQWPLLGVGSLMVAGPWYTAITMRQGWAFIDEFFLEHHFSRFSSSALQHAQPFWFYLPVIVGLTLPWTPLLARAPWRQPAWRLFAGTAIFGFLFFSAATNKLPGYLLPLLPPLAVLAAAGMPERSRWPARGAWVMAGVLVLAKLVAMPVLDPKLTPREASRNAPADACLDDVPRGFRYGLQYYLRRQFGECWQMPGAQPILAEQRQANSPVLFHFTHSGPKPVTGRILVFASAEAPTGQPVLPDNADPNRVWIASRDVVDWAAGVRVTLDPLRLAFPGPITSAPAGTYHLTALFDPDSHFPYSGPEDGDWISSVRQMEIRGNETQAEVEFALDKRWNGTPEAQPSLTVPSPLLSRFHRRPVAIRADVLPGTQPGRALVLHAFGESFAASRLRTLLTAETNRPTLYFLDARHRFGHHAFADSAVNGPWARALVEEFLPSLGEGDPPDLIGDGLGGWGAVNLKQSYPERFARVRALDPDPLDFRNFFQVDLTARPNNLYRKPDGSRRPFQGPWEIETSAIRETVLGPDGGRWESWEAILGPRTSEGISRELFGRDKGEVDHSVLEEWLRHDLARRPMPLGTRILSESEVGALLQSN